MASPSGPISETKESSLERRTCDMCAKEAPLEEKPLQVCGRCGGRRYCSPSCQFHDWPRHKARCAKRPSAGPNKEPLRTKADRDHDAKVRADEQATAMENLLRAGEHDNDDFQAIFQSDSATPQAIKDLAMTGVRERIASGELSNYVAGLICYRRIMFLSAEGATWEPVTDKVRVYFKNKFKLNEAMFLRTCAGMNALLDSTLGEVVAPLLSPPEAKAALAAMGFPKKLRIFVAMASQTGQVAGSAPASF